MATHDSGRRGVLPRKGRWHRRDRQRSPEELATVLAASAWRAATDAVGGLQAAGVAFASADRLLDGVAELLAFLVHAADRCALARLPPPGRSRLLHALALHLKQILDDNRADLRAGAGRDFIDHLNRRLADYAELPWAGAGPGYGTLRYLGQSLAETAPAADQAWVVQHAVEVLGPAAFARFDRQLQNMLAPPGDAPAG